MKKQVLAFLLAFVVVAATLDVLCLGATRVGADGKTLIIASTNYNPSPGQQYALSGILLDGSGNPLANAPIDIF